MESDQVKRIIEALLFVSDRPLMSGQIKDVLEEADAQAIQAAVAQLRSEYQQDGRSFNITDSSATETCASSNHTKTRDISPVLAGRQRLSISETRPGKGRDQPFALVFAAGMRNGPASRSSTHEASTGRSGDGHATGLIPVERSSQSSGRPPKRQIASPKLPPWSRGLDSAMLSDRVIAPVYPIPRG